MVRCCVLKVQVQLDGSLTFMYLYLARCSAPSVLIANGKGGGRVKSAYRKESSDSEDCIISAQYHEEEERKTRRAGKLNVYSRKLADSLFAVPWRSLRENESEIPCYRLLACDV
jgi:hypothetical protein